MDCREGSLKILAAAEPFLSLKVEKSTSHSYAHKYNTTRRYDNGLISMGSPDILAIQEQEDFFGPLEWLAFFIPGWIC